MRAFEAAQRRQEREARLAYEASREAQVQKQTDEIRQHSDAIASLLRRAKDSSAPLNFSSLKAKAKYPPFTAEGQDIQEPLPEHAAFMPPPLQWWERLFGRVTEYNRIVAEAEASYSRALEEHEQAEQLRLKRLENLRTAYRETCDSIDRDVSARNQEVDQFKTAYERREREAVVRYFELVFEKDELPRGFPKETRVAFDIDSQQLVIERRLPVLADLPAKSAFKYVKKTDSIDPVMRRPSELRSIYSDAIAQVAVRTLRVALAADVAQCFVVIAFNGFVDTIDPATGNRVRPTLISLSASRDSLNSIAFDNVDAGACLRNLRALVSRSAHELAPVRPLVSFDMVDRRFVDKTDVLTALDQRPNLADLTPGEFEALMTNLFEKMGLETRLTQASRDGGVDCVAWDMRPVIGGKVIVQAKRYKHTVGVSAVRDLFGTMMNEGAAKGILVTTSGYGKSAYEFAKSKPIELITGSNLLSMLSEYAHVDAKIEFPADWIDATEPPEPVFAEHEIANGP